MMKRRRVKSCIRSRASIMSESVNDLEMREMQSWERHKDESDADMRELRECGAMSESINDYHV
jgi:hypothetical protein